MKKYFVIRGRTIILLNVLKQSRSACSFKSWSEFVSSVHNELKEVSYWESMNQRIPSRILRHSDFVIDVDESRFIKNRPGECDIGFFKLDDVFDHIKNFYSDLNVDICYKFYKIYDLDYRNFNDVEIKTEEIIKRLNFGVLENVELRNYNDY